VSYTINQRSVPFHKKIRSCENVTALLLAELMTYVNTLLSKYSICSFSVSVGKIKEKMWKHFTDITEKECCLIFDCILYILVIRSFCILL